MYPSVLPQVVCLRTLVYRFVVACCFCFATLASNEGQPISKGQKCHYTINGTLYVCDPWVLYALFYWYDVRFIGRNKGGWCVRPCFCRCGVGVASGREYLNNRFNLLCYCGWVRCVNRLDRWCVFTSLFLVHTRYRLNINCLDLLSRHWIHTLDIMTATLQPLKHGSLLQP